MPGGKCERLGLWAPCLLRRCQLSREDGDATAYDLPSGCGRSSIKAEVAFQEYKTAEFLAAELELLGFEVSRVWGRLGLWGCSGFRGRAVCALRADMDALPIGEETGVPYAEALRGNARLRARYSHGSCFDVLQVFCRTQVSVQGHFYGHFSACGGDCSWCPGDVG